MCYAVRMAASDSPETATEYTVDQLAQDADLPVSTVRMYQNRGLMDPPQKRGRVGYYSQDHRERLRLIARLQERGFSLAAIKEAIDSWHDGHSLDELLGVTDLAPNFSRQTLRLAPAELARRFEGVGLTQQEIQRAVAVGLIEIDGAEVVITNPPFADIGPAVADLGVPVSEMLDEYEVLRRTIDDMAERFRAVFDRHLWEHFVSDGMQADRIPDLTDAAARLAQLASALVGAELNARFAEFVQDYVDRAEQGLADQESADQSGA